MKDMIQTEGYTIVSGLFSSAEVEFFLQHFMALREGGERPGDFSGVDVTSEDPLKRYPRMIHMHRWDPVSLNWLIDPRIGQAMTALLGRSPYAVQTMLYFKPPSCSRAGASPGSVLPARPTWDLHCSLDGA